jgi:hypothetical protein
MVLYPTEEWLAEYKRQLNGNDGFAADSSGWGVGFNGDFLYVITDLPIGTTTVGDLPREAFDGLPGSIRWPLSAVALDGVATPIVDSLYAPVLRLLNSGLTLSSATTLVRGSMRWHLPEQTENLLRQLDEHVVDNTIYAFIGLEDGECTEVDILTSPTERDVGFVLRGPNRTWGRVVDGDLDIFSAVGSSSLVLDSTEDTRHIAQYHDAMHLLGEIAADVETTRLF